MPSASGHVVMSKYTLILTTNHRIETPIEASSHDQAMEIARKMVGELASDVTQELTIRTDKAVEGTATIHAYVRDEHDGHSILTTVQYSG